MSEVPEVPEVPTTMLLPYNRRLLPLVGEGDGMEMNQKGGEPRWGKMVKKKDICQPNITALIINIINMAKKVIRPKRAPTTMLLPYNRRLLPLVGPG